MIVLFQMYGLWDFVYPTQKCAAQIDLENYAWRSFAHLDIDYF